MMLFLYLKEIIKSAKEEMVEQVRSAPMLNRPVENNWEKRVVKLSFCSGMKSQHWKGTQVF